MEIERKTVLDSMKHAITPQKTVTSRYLLSIPRYEKANILGANWFTTE